MPWIRKLPPIPTQLLIDVLSGEPMPIIAGVMNIILWQIEREKYDRPSNEKLAILSHLKAFSWQEYGQQVIKAYDIFMQGFTKVLEERERIGKMQRAKALMASQVHIDKTAKRKKEAKLSDAGDKPIADVLRGVNTYIPDTHHRSDRFDAVARSKALLNKKAKKGTPDVYFKD